jgi:thioredoxin reductase (NADPH)
MTDIFIAGLGPAGVSAAVYAARAGLSVVLCGRDAGALAKAEKIENYYGFIDPISGPDLLHRGLDQAERLGVTIVRAEITGISWDSHFTVDTDRGPYLALAVILATGMPRRKAAVPGLADFEGRGVSYCATCDGFFYRGKTVAVIGNGEYALREAGELKPFAKEIVLLTNGRPFEAGTRDEQIRLITDKILRVEGDEQVRRLVLSGEQTIPVDGVFVAEGTASALDLALKLGLANDGQAITVDQDQATSLPGLFAAGDCTGGRLQIAVAVGEGAKAGLAAVEQVRLAKGETLKGPVNQWGGGAGSAER